MRCASLLLIASLAAGCGPLLGLQDVTTLCASGDECPSGFCSAEGLCDDTQWVLRLGDGAAQQVVALELFDPDQAGSAPPTIVAAGSFEGTIDFGDGALAADGSDVFVVALDERGSPRWRQVLGGPGWQRPTAMTIDRGDGGVVVMGLFEQTLRWGAVELSGAPDKTNGFVAKLAADGTPLWATGFASAQLLPRALLTGQSTQGRGVFAVGGYTGAVEAGAAMTAPSGLRWFTYFLLLSHETGQVWGLSEMTGTGDVQACCVSSDIQTGTGLIGGTFDGTASYAGQQLPSSGQRDGFALVTQIEPGGAFTQLLRVGDITDDQLQVLDTDAAGRLLLATRVDDDPLGPSGYLQRTSLITADVSSTRVPFDAVGGFAAVSLTPGPGDGAFAFGRFGGQIELLGLGPLSAIDQDLFLVVLDDSWQPDGRSMVLGGPGDETAAGLVVDAAGDVIVAGGFEQRLDIVTPSGGRSLQSAGLSDAFIAKLRLTP